MNWSSGHERVGTLRCAKEENWGLVLITEVESVTARLLAGCAAGCTCADSFPGREKEGTGAPDICSIAAW